MSIDWLKFFGAIVLLLPPIGLFHGPRVRYRAVMRDWDGYWGRTLSLGLHAIDFSRAALGAWLLIEALVRQPEARGIIRFAPLMIHAAIFFVATTLQTFVCKEEEAAHAPLAYVAGLAVGYMPPIIAGFALLLAVAVSAGAHSAPLFFPALAICVAGLATLFKGKSLMLQVAVIGVAVALPWLLTLLFPRHFVVSYRARKADTSPQAAPR